MPRTKGALNITPFPQRTKIPTKSVEAVAHLADTDKSPLNSFKQLLTHQENFRKWLEWRDKYARNLGEQLNEYRVAEGKPLVRGPKNASTTKYQWYSRQLVLLETIMAFEVFFKRTLIATADAGAGLWNLGKSEIKVRAEMFNVHSTDSIGLGEVLFGSRLFHRAEEISDACKELVGKQWLKKGTEKSLSIDRIFQVRHCLSHNAGLITPGDQARLRALGLDAETSEVIDPSADYLHVAIMDYCRAIAEDFVEWLRTETIDFLKKRVNTGLMVEGSRKSRFELALGATQDWDQLSWSP